MKILRLKRIILLSMFCFAVGCMVNPAKTTPSKTEPKTFYGPENQYYYFTAAQVQRKKGNLDKAVSLLQKAIELDPGSSYLQRELVTVYLQNKENDKAIEVLEEMLQKNPEDLRSLIIYGGIKQVRKETDDAIAIYEKILALDPKQQRIYSLLGGLYMETGVLERAVEVFNRELENFPGSYTGHFYLGKIYAKQGRIKKAETEFRKALEIRPDRSEPRFELIDIYKTRGKTKKVVGLYVEILQSNPSNVRAAMELGYYHHQQGKKEDAEKYLIKLGARSQNEFEVIINVIQLYIDPKKFDEALVVINAMLKGAPDNPDIHHLAGISYYGIKNNDRALFHFGKVSQESRFFQDAVVHVAFNVIGVLVWLPLIWLLVDIATWISPSSPELAGSARAAAEVPRQIANANTFFNVINTLLFIGFTGSFARLAEWLVRERAPPGRAHHRALIRRRGRSW